MWAGPEHWHFKLRHKASAEKKKKRNTKKAFEVNFDEDVDSEIYFRETKAALTLSKSILENQNMKSTTLPADFNYSPNNIIQLFLKPDVKLFRLPEPGSSLDHEDEIGEHDYSNPNDTSNFCPAARVNKIVIRYTKTAKKMDMKRLKQNMWDLLIDMQENTAAEIEGVEKQSGASVVTGEKAFSSITKGLSTCELIPTEGWTPDWADLSSAWAVS